MPRPCLFNLLGKPIVAGGRSQFLQRRSDSRVGRFLLCRVTGKKRTNDIWAMPLAVDRKPFAFIATQFDENYARFSPDGRWLAYTSNESGRPEVYVAPFPGGNGKWQVSSAGGAFPRWRGDGRELYCLAADNTLIAVTVASTATGFEVGGSQNLFKANPPTQGGYPYAVSADGQRFLFNTDVAPPTPITVVVNWTAGLR